MEHNSGPPTYNDVFFQAMESGLSNGVYIVDTQTHEIVYINHLLCEAMGEGKSAHDYVGKRCHECFMGIDHPCSYCTLDAMRKDPLHPTTLKMYNPHLNTHMQVNSTLISWVDGREVMLHNVQTDQPATRALPEKVNGWARKDAVAAVARHLAANGGVKNVFDVPLRLVIDLLGVDEAFIMRCEPELCEFVHAHSQCRKDCTSVLKTIGSIPCRAGTARHARLLHNKPIYESDLYDLLPDSVRSNNRMIALPIWLNGAVWGVFGCIDARTGFAWPDLDVEFLYMISDMFTGELERSAIEINLMKTELTLRSVIDHTPFAIFWKDTDLVYRGVNEQLLKIVNGRREDVIGKTDYEVQPQRAEEIRQDDLEIIRTKVPYSADSLEAQWFDGSKRWLRVFKTPIMDENDNVLFILGTITDITKDKESEMALLEHDRQLQASMLEAKRANQAKSTFLSRMSHEMRTPMNAIIGMTGIAQKSNDITRIRDALNKITCSSSHLLSIINDILDMSKIESGKLALTIEPFHLPTLISQVYTVVSVRVEEKNQRLMLNIDDDVPEYLKSDALRLTQVLTNLLYNAVKFSGNGSEIKLNISVAWRQERTLTLRFEVTDHGIGISDGQFERLFTPFEQGDGSTARQYGGTGLGLSITKSIVELMGGDIGVVSRLGEGSTFRFCVPVETADESETFMDALDEDDLSTLDFTGKCILLAEDIDINREIVLALLEDTNVTIDVAENGLEAVEKVTASPERYDLILMDIQMPIMDGYRATEHIKGINPAIPVLAMTANAFKEDVEEGHRRGMSDHIAKPIHPKILLRKIAQHMI